MTPAGLVETWWDESHNWSAAMGACKLFRRNHQGRGGSGVVLNRSVSVVSRCLMTVMIRWNVYG